MSVEDLAPLPPDLQRRIALDQERSATERALSASDMNTDQYDSVQMARETREELGIEAPDLDELNRDELNRDEPDRDEPDH